MTSQPKNTAQAILGQNKGQLILEYILLIFVVASVAVLLSSTLVGRGEGRRGVIVTKWNHLIEMIGQDVGD